MIFIIEHLEPELGEWSLIEYKHISKIVGPKHLWFTNVPEKDVKKLKKLGKVLSAPLRQIGLKRMIILDPEAPSLLTPDDALNHEYIILGGILGDYPPRKRTQQELTCYFPEAETRNIGKVQMSTDNAVYTAQQILHGIPFSKLKFQDNITIQLNKIESVDFPFRYNVVNGKPLFSPELIKYLKKKETL
ncbi:MAG: SAM-dependent methyltransferase [archaeon]